MGVAGLSILQYEHIVNRLNLGRRRTAEVKPFDRIVSRFNPGKGAGGVWRFTVRPYCKSV